MATSTISANAILFAINSSIRLGTRFRRAYAQKLQSKELILPLPSFDSNANETKIAFFFEAAGKNFLKFQETERLKLLHEKAKRERLSAEELEEYREYYDIFFELTIDNTGGPNISEEEALQILHLKQWQNDRYTRTSALQLVAGSIIELGIDYFHQVPGAINVHSAHGRAIKHFLSALDEINFAEDDKLKRRISHVLMPRLFAAAAESVNELAPEIVGDEQLQNLIKAAAKGVANDIYGKIDEGMIRSQREEIINWGQIILRGLIKNAGEYTFTNTRQLFGTNEGASQLVSNTGLALLDTILEDDHSGINLKEVFTIDALDGIIKSAFTTLSEYPQLISNQDGIKNIIKEVSLAMAQSGIDRPGLAPEFIRLIIEKASLSVDLFWKETPEGAENLLVNALQQILGVLAQKDPVSGEWIFNLSNTQILDIVYSLTDDIIAHPEWLVKTEDQNTSVLSTVLGTTLNALGNIPQQQRFSHDTLNWLLELNLRTVATSNRVLNLVKWGDGQTEVAILDKALDLIFSFVYKNPATADNSKFELLADILDYGLASVLRANPNKKGLILIQLLLFEDSGIDYSAGFSRTLADQFIDSAIVVLDEHTELIVKDDFFVKIISDTAHALRTTSLERSNLLPEIIRLVLKNTSGNLDVLIDVKEEETEHLLVFALQQILEAVSQPPSVGKWKPSLTDYQLLDIIDLVFEKVISHPVWVRNGTKDVFEVLRSIFVALESIPSREKIPYLVIRYLVEEAFQATSVKKELSLSIETQPGLQKQLVIEYSLESFFIILYDENLKEETKWNLTQADVFNELISFFLTSLTETNGEKSAVDQVLKNLKSAIDLYVRNVINTTEELLIALESQNDFV